MLTWVEISSSALNHNIRQFKSLVGQKSMLMPVVKANAYGHGIVPIARLCDANAAVDRLAVAGLEEAITLLRAGIHKPLMILSFYELNCKEDCRYAARNGVVFPVYQEEQARDLNRLAQSIHKKITVHLKIDIGTSRVGFLPNNDSLNRISLMMKKYSWLAYEGLWGHFAESEENNVRTQEQTKIFLDFYNALQARKCFFPLVHVACSAASLKGGVSACNLSRIGLALYGLYPSEKIASVSSMRLKPVLAWHTKIIQVKTVPKGTKIGYGGTYITPKETTIAVLPIGYYDGYDRRFSNQASVLLRGQRCPVRGRICMNLAMIEITGMAKVKVGEKVALIGKSGNTRVTVDELAAIAGTINYEIVDRINPLLPRIIVA